jgi:hypothetical protein
LSFEEDRTGIYYGPALKKQSPDFHIISPIETGGDAPTKQGSDFEAAKID